MSCVSRCLTEEDGHASFHSFQDLGETFHKSAEGNCVVQLSSLEIFGLSLHETYCEALLLSLNLNVNIRGYMIIGNMDARKVFKT